METSIKLKSSDLATLKCGKSIGWSSFSLGNIYFEVSLGANIDFKYQLKTKNESNEIETSPEVSGGFIFTPKFGIESNPEASEYIYADVNLNISAGTKAVWPYQGDNGKIANYFYLGNTNLSISGYVDGWLVGGKKEINPPINFVLFNTYTESDTKLVFDIKNGEIYLEDN